MTALLLPPVSAAVLLAATPAYSAGMSPPLTRSVAVHAGRQDVIVSIRADGSILVDGREVPFVRLARRVRQDVETGDRRPLVLRADDHVRAAMIAHVVDALAAGGFTSIDLVGESSSFKPGDGVGVAEP